MTAKRHFVHVYATIPVKVEVEAHNHAHAMAIAHDVLFDRGFGVRLSPAAPGVIDAEYAEEVTAYLVDEADDPEYERSTTYNANHERDEGCSSPAPVESKPSPATFHAR